MNFNALKISTTISVIVLDLTPLKISMKLGVMVLDINLLKISVRTQDYDFRS